MQLTSEIAEGRTEEACRHCRQSVAELEQSGSVNYINPKTGKGWTDREKQIIAHIRIVSNDSGSTVKGLEALVSRLMDSGWTPCAVVFSQRLSTDGRLILIAGFTEFADPEAKSRVMESLKLRRVQPLREE